MYRAHDRNLSRAVAIKLMRNEMVSADLLVRFKQEIELTTRLDHAHILRVYDSGTFNGRPFVVMEYAVGRSLADRLLEERILPVADALSIIHDVGQALAHAHRNAVIHRDVKPENILLTASGAYLADFGIARITSEHVVERLTSTGVAVGTIQYMSPEQLCAEPNIDSRSDQYSLGCVLYEMLAGVKPHIAASMEGLRVMRTSGGHTPLRMHRESVSPALERAVDIALSPIAADRFSTIQEFLSSLTSSVLVADRTVKSPTVSKPNLRRMIVAASALTAAALVAAAAKWSVVGESEIYPGTVALTPAPDDSAGQRLSTLLAAELGLWDGVRVVKQSTRETPSISVAPVMTQDEDSAHVILSVREGSSGAITRSVHTYETKLFRESEGQIIGQLSRTILAGNLATDHPEIELLPNRSIAAMRHYALGHRLLALGQLDSAKSHFADSHAESPQFGSAAFWAAQVGFWQQPQVSREWLPLAQSAAQSAGILPMDSVLARALQLMASDFPAACNEYRNALRINQRSFVAHFGLGECQRLDGAVLSNSQGFQFRSSHWSALAAYRNAIADAPPSKLLAVLFAQVLPATYASGTQVRFGWSVVTPADSFDALPSLQGDTIAFIPVPRRVSRSMGRSSVPDGLDRAVNRGRHVAVELTTLWTNYARNSSIAWLQHAGALEMLGPIPESQNAALLHEALARAEGTDSTASTRASIAVIRTRVALRLGNVELAVATARRILSSADTADRAAQPMLAPLAGFIGDFRLALQLTPVVNENTYKLSDNLNAELLRFRIAAAAGDCDAVKSQRDRLSTLFSTQVARANFESVKSEYLRPAFRQAVPCLDVASFDGFNPEIPLDRAVQALSRHNNVQAISVLDSLRTRRRGTRGAAVTWDHLFAESWTLMRAGDTVSARNQILTGLEGLASVSPSLMQEVAQASGLRRAMILFAQTKRVEGSASDRAWVEKAEKFLLARQ